MFKHVRRLSAIVKSIEERYGLSARGRLRPTFPRHNDVYIVEFPRSGVTWLSSLLANLALIESGRKELASFNSAHFYVPDIHLTREIGDVAYDRPPVRMIKSHAEYNRGYLFVIYLVRHPVDVMKSYYRFYRDMQYPSLSIESFVRSNVYGVPSWKRHVNSWINNKVSAQRLHLLKYEDLISDPARELGSISENFGWAMSSAAISEAVARSSIEEMQRAEEYGRLRNPNYTMNFVRNKAPIDIGEGTIEYIVESCREEMKLLKYSKS
jgi:hypothetical protein